MKLAHRHTLQAWLFLAPALLLLADLHGPGRFYHFYIYFQPQSWAARAPRR